MINQTCPFIMKDLYSYDIVSAFPTIMQNQNFSFAGVDITNKTERNIFIGKQQIKNKELSSFLNDSVKNLTDFYLSFNEISDEDVVFRQKDGFIITKPLTNNNMYIEMKMRNMIPLLFIDSTRSCLLYIKDDDNVEVKGVRHYYDSLMTVYKMFFELDFYNLSTLCLQLKKIKDYVVYNKDKLFFGINGDDIQYTFILKNGKKIRTPDPDFVELSEIDTRKYFDFYFKPFTDAVFMEGVYKK